MQHHQVKTRKILHKKNIKPDLYWKVVGYSEKHIWLSGTVGNVVIDKYDRGEGLQGARFTCYAKAEDDLYAEITARQTFDTFLRGVILASGIAYDIHMDRPKQVTIEEVDDKKLIIPYDKKITQYDSFLVKPFRDYALPLFSKEEVIHWLKIIEKKRSNQDIQRLITLYCKGIRLWRISKNDGYMNFIKIVEFFINKKYRQEFERKIFKEKSGAFKIKNFSKYLFSLLKKHFPNISEAKTNRLVKQISQKVSLSSVYTNYQLLEFLCKNSGFYKTILSRRKNALRESIDQCYSYWSENKRKLDYEKLYAKHEKYILTASKTLYKERPYAAHVGEKAEVSRGALRMCHLLARFLIEKLVEGKIIFT